MARLSQPPKKTELRSAPFDGAAVVGGCVGCAVGTSDECKDGCAELGRGAKTAMQTVPSWAPWLAREGRRHRRGSGWGGCRGDADAALGSDLRPVGLVEAEGRSRSLGAGCTAHCKR